MTLRAVRRRRSVMITGAGVGLGREIALRLAAKGWVVFGTFGWRRPAKSRVRLASVTLPSPGLDLGPRICQR